MSNDDRNILTRRGRLELSKYWPDGTRFRRPFPNVTLARQMRARIDAAIATGTWTQLKEELSLKQEPPAPPLTLRHFAPTYMEHVEKKNRRPDFHRIQLGNILPVLGDRPLKAIGRVQALEYRESRPAHLKPATINRGMAVLRSLVSYAIERGFILAPHPLFGLRDYPEIERDLKVMTLSEERTFVAALLNIDVAVGVYAGVMGETAIRSEEGLRLIWRCFDMPGRMVTVPAEIAKTKKTRHIPMSDFCRDLLGMLPRVTKDPHVFIRTSTLKPVKDTRGAFSKARERTGLDVYPESFRHFRITQWMSQGIDPITVQELAGHKDIHTTRRYAHFAPSFAARTIIEAQRAEAISLQQLMVAFEQGVGPKQDQTVSELERLYGLEAGK